MPQIPTPAPPSYMDPRVESLPPPPKPERDLSGTLDGIVIPVWAGDLYLAKACCASVRESMGDIPITLFVDGASMDTSELERLHNVKRLVVQDVLDGENPSLWTGTPWTKVLLFWVSPYERFLCIDADTLVWGDLRVYAEFDRYDFIVTYHNSIKFETPEEAQRGLFDLDVVKNLDPILEWRGREVTNTGVFFARRNVFSRENMVMFRKLKGWPCYESGVFNYLHWRALREGIPRTIAHRLQLYPAEFALRPEHRYLSRDSKRPSIIHWVTKKPKLGRRFRAADDYRKLFLKMTGRSHFLDTRLFLEDLGVWLQRQKRSLAKRFKPKSRTLNKSQS